METAAKKVECPKCGSVRQERLTKTFFFLFLLGGGSCLIWLGLILWPALIAGGAMILLSFATPAFPKSYKCLDCNSGWTEKQEWL
jgi:DNA-directed RNA polymerase subunit RPC12/RpoP